jgi:hypothetical protein
MYITNKNKNMRIVCKESEIKDSIVTKFVIYLCVGNQPIECHVETTQEDKDNRIEKLMDNNDIESVTNISYYEFKNSLE